MAVIEHTGVTDTVGVGPVTTTKTTVLTLDAADMTGSTEYLVLYSCNASASNGSTAPDVDLEFDGSPLTNQPHRFNQHSDGTSTTQYMHGFGFQRYTQPSTPVDITQTIVRQSGGGNVYSRYSSLFAMSLADLTEDTNFHYAEDDDLASNTALTTSPVAFASLTFTPVANAVYLILTSCQVDVAGFSTFHNGDLQIAGSSFRIWAHEQESGSEDTQSGFAMIYTAGASPSATTFEMRLWGDSAGAAGHAYSQVMAIQLTGVFTEFDSGHDASTAHSTSPVEVVGVVVPVLAATRDVLVLASTLDNVSSSSRVIMDIQEGGSSQFLTGQLGDQNASRTHNITSMFLDEAVGSGTRSYDLDLDQSGTGGTWEETDLIAFGLDIVSATVHDGAATVTGAGTVTSVGKQIHELDGAGP